MHLTQQQKDVLAAAVRFYLAADDEIEPSYLRNILQPILTELEGGVSCAVVHGELQPTQKKPRFFSNAIWPEGTICGGPDSSQDAHWTYGEAKGVCDLLKRNGFGGDKKVFPLDVWVSQDNPVDDSNLGALRSKDETTQLRKEEGTQRETPSHFDSHGRFIEQKTKPCNCGERGEKLSWLCPEHGRMYGDQFSVDGRRLY